MQASPPPAEFSNNGAGTNHSFSASMNICGNCHGDYTGGTLQAVIHSSLADLEDAIAEAALGKLLAAGTVYVRAYDPATDLYSSAAAANPTVALDLVANPITNVGLAEGHGQVELELTLTTPISITWSNASTTTTSHFGVQLGSAYLDAPVGGVSSTRVFSPNGDLFKACWNYFLIEADGSAGVHNPSFAMNVINASLARDLSL
jgi:hypothetical protein